MKAHQLLSECFKSVITSPHEASAFDVVKQSDTTQSSDF